MTQELSIVKEFEIQGNSYGINADLEVGLGVIAGFKIAQKKDKHNKTLVETVIGYDPTKLELYVDRSKAGNEKTNRDKLLQTIDLQNDGDRIKLEILFDKSSLEILGTTEKKFYNLYIY